MRYVLAALVPVIAIIAWLFWPSSPRDEPVHVTPQALQRLGTLKPELNFGPDNRDFYSGMLDPTERAYNAGLFGTLVEGLERDLPRHPSKRLVLDRLLATLKATTVSDTEDRERAGVYCEKIMAALDIKSSDGVLNVWLYGPILGRLVSRHG